MARSINGRSRLHYRMPPEVYGAVRQLCESRHFDAGTVLFSEGDPPKGVYLIDSGAIVLTIPCSTSKDEPFSRKAGPECILGLPSAISNVPFSLSAKATRDTEAGFITSDRLHRFLKANPDICFQVLTLLAEEIRSTRIKR